MVQIFIWFIYNRQISYWCKIFGKIIQVAHARLCARYANPGCVESACYGSPVCMDFAYCSQKRERAILFVIWFQYKQPTVQCRTLHERHDITIIFHDDFPQFSPQNVDMVYNSFISLRNLRLRPRMVQQQTLIHDFLQKQTRNTN